MKARSTGRTSLGSVGADQIQIGGIGIDHAAAGVGHQGALGRGIDHRLDQRTAAVPAGRPQDAGGEREHQEHADRRQDGQQCQDVRLRVGAADEHQRHCRADQHDGDQQHETDAAAARIVPLRSIAARVLASVDWISAMMVVATLAHVTASRRRIISRLTSFTVSAQDVAVPERVRLLRTRRRAVGGNPRFAHHAGRANGARNRLTRPSPMPSRHRTTRCATRARRYFDTYSPPGQRIGDPGLTQPYTPGVSGHLPLNRRLPREILGTWTGWPGGLSFLILR